MLLAAFSDVHANINALEAVLADIARRGADRIVCLGDLVGYGANPNEVIDRVREQQIPTVLGNYDDGVGFERDECGCAYTDPGDIEQSDRSLRWTQQIVTEDDKAWLRSLPSELRFDAGGIRFLCLHGSPRRLNEYLYEDRPEASLTRMFTGVEADVVLCGHTHLPYHRRVADLHLINTGTSGRPRYGDTKVCYALVEMGPDVMTEFPRVCYDYEAAARAIEATDLPREFAHVLRTGTY